MNEKVKEAYEEWAEEWQPVFKENHPNLYSAFEAGWLAALEAMLSKVGTFK